MSKNETLLTEFEVFPELIAEYLIKGRVKLANPKSNKTISKIEDSLNKKITELFRAVEGKVLVEI